MTARKKPNAPADDQAPEVLQPEFADPADIAIQKVLGELGDDPSGVKVNLYRPAAQGRKMTFLKSYAPSEFTPEAVQIDFPLGGDFHVHVRQNGELVTRAELSIEPLPVKPEAPPDSGAQMQPVIATMMEGFKMLAEGMRQTQAQTQSRTEMLKEMAMMKDLFAPAQSAAPAQVDQMSLVLKGMELAKQFGGDAAPDPSGNRIWEKLIETFGAPIAGIVAQAQTGAKPAPAATKQLPVPAQSELANGAQIEKDKPAPENDEMFKRVKFKAAMVFIHQQAIAGNPVETYAEMAVDNVPAEDLQPLMERPDWLAALAEVEPGVMQHQEWYGALRTEILRLLTAPVESDSVAGDGST